ncbi:diaminopimelate epimerase [Halobacterium wangiae]|uniref:diaminopimelate epimerase n=1 Tax=Halobacterium wangiae TaxID=2902623 RepID=UPI001E5664F4|nr:diaminopimelate epimerase [Halobacterium wangiae]
MIPYDRYHGTGNDFVIVDATEYVPDRGAFAQALCDSQGVDGVLFLALEDAYTPPRAVMTLFQPDGSTADMCGNGARCAARWVAERTDADAVMLDTQAGTRRADVDGETVTVEMGTPRFEPTEVPVRRDEAMVEEPLAGYEVTAVDTGVPHAVVFVDDVDDVDVETNAPAIRHHEAFPDGANVTFASPDGDGEFRQRTFERGVEGETRSCGTGAVAIAAVAHRDDRCGEQVRVRPPGGVLHVDLSGGRATLRGATEQEAGGEVEAVPARSLDA